MEISSSGAGSLAHNTPTQTGSMQQIKLAEQQSVQETSAQQESLGSTAQGERIGSLINVSV